MRRSWRGGCINGLILQRLNPSGLAGRVGHALAKPLGSHVRAYNKINAITRVFLV